MLTSLDVCHLAYLRDQCNTAHGAGPRGGNLLLSNDRGVYTSMYIRQGIDRTAECAKDARHMYGLPIPDSYCTTGVDADVILYPVMSQYTKNVAGWGVDAGKDQHGRPLIIIVGWSPPTGLEAYSDLEARATGPSAADNYPPHESNLVDEWANYGRKVGVA